MEMPIAYAIETKKWRRLWREWHSAEWMDELFAKSDYRTDGDYKEYLGRVAGSVANYLQIADPQSYRHWYNVCLDAMRGGE
jgi:hypothetical protein